MCRSHIKWEDRTTKAKSTLLLFIYSPSKSDALETDQTCMHAYILDSNQITANKISTICYDARHRRSAFGESPRRVLSFSKRRKSTVSFPDPDDKAASGFGVSGDHCTKSSEVYGFVGSTTTVVATVIFLVWAYVPENWLHTIGIFYYPNKYWALAVPTYAMLIILLALLFYVGLNSMSTPPPSSLNTIFDGFSREPSTFIPSREGDE